MASRRDELRAHQFLKQRAVSALVVHQTDPEHPPFRRPTVSMFWSLGLALLGLTIAGVLSFFHSNSSVKLDNGKNVLISDNGEKYVKLNNVLHPVTSFSSAELALGENKGTQNVTRDQIVGMPLGPEIGIPGSPDDLPSKDHLWPGAWNLCSQPVLDPTDGKTWLYKSVLAFARAPAGGTPLGSDYATLARANGAGPYFLVYEGYRHRLRNASVDLAAFAGASALPVNPVWLESIPTGPDIKPMSVSGEGTSSSALGSDHRSRRGQIWVAGGADATQYYLVLGNKLRPITELQAKIQLATTRIRLAYPGTNPAPLTLSADQLSGQSRKSTVTNDPSAPPASPPRHFVRPDPNPALNTMCSSYAPGQAVPQLTAQPSLPRGGTTVGGRNRTGTALADRVDIEPGWGALVRVVGNQDKSVGGTTALITSDGTLYPLAADSNADSTVGAPASNQSPVAGILGYSTTVNETITGALASRLPRGPLLDPVAAKMPVPR